MSWVTTLDGIAAPDGFVIRGMFRLVRIVLLANAAVAYGADAPQLTPQDVQKIGDSEFQISWRGQGTLICNGAASIPTFRVPDDLAPGQWLECHVVFAEGKSNQVRVRCSQSACTAHVGRAKNEFVIQPQTQNDGERPRLIVERVVGPVAEAPPPSERLIPDGYALQLAAGKDKAALAQLAKTHQLDDVRIYAIESRGEPYYVLIYGYYRSEDSATAAARSLPAALPDSWVRSTRSLKAAIISE